MNSSNLFFPMGALVNVITSITLGFFVYTRNKRDIKNITYGLFCFSISIWSLFYFMWQITGQANVALLCSRALMMGAIFIPIFYLHHILSLLNLHNIKKHIIILAYISGIVFLGFVFSPYFITGVMPQMSFKFWPMAGFLFSIFLPIWFLIVLYGVYVILKAYKNSTRLVKSRMRYILIATIVGWGGGATNYPLWYGVPILPVGNILVSGYIIITAYAMVRYRLMNIDEAIALTAAFITICVPIVAIPFVVGYTTGLWMFAVVLAIILAPAALYAYNRAKGRVLTERLSFQEAVTDIAETLKQTRSLDELLKTITGLTVQKLKVFHASLYLVNPGTKHFERKSFEVSKRYKEKLKDIYTIDKEDAIIRYLSKNREPIVYDEIIAMHHNANNTTLKEIGAELESMGSSIILPIIYKKGADENIIAVIVLGERLSYRPYGDSEIKALNLLSEHIGLAIVNAQFVIKKEERAVKNVAIGASHQMFNALAVVVTTIEVAKTIIDQKEMKNLTEEETRDLLDFAKTQIDLAVSEGHRSKKILTSILYEAKAREGFKPVNIYELITHVIGYSSQLKTKDFLEKNIPIPDVANNIPRDFPTIIGNEGLLRESFINLLNNAYDAIWLLYIKELPRKKSYRGMITLKGEDRGANIAILIEDNGIGMNDYTKEKVFSAYYTTKGSDKGTGAGLFSLKGWIEKHSGSITFKTGYGKGTTFTVELPKKQEGLS